jgi:ribonuclease BN (tRNA processing enzyme)
MDMVLTVIGRWAPMPATGGACAGYLLQEGDTAVLIDCGHAVMSYLGRHIDYNRLAAVVLTHHHDDHQADLYALRQAVAIDLRRGLRRERLVVYAPDEPEDEWRRLQMPFALDTRAYRPGEGFAVGPLQFTTARTRHALPCAALRVEAGGRTFVFSADTAPTPAVGELARGADLFLCEASYLEPGDGPPDIHLAAAEAGELARGAGVGRLLLTHFHPRADVDAIVARAAAAFGGPCAAAEEGCSYPV